MCVSVSCCSVRTHPVYFIWTVAHAGLPWFVSTSGPTRVRTQNHSIYFQPAFTSCKIKHVAWGEAWRHALTCSAMFLCHIRSGWASGLYQTEVVELRSGGGVWSPHWCPTDLLTQSVFYFYKKGVKVRHWLREWVGGGTSLSVFIMTQRWCFCWQSVSWTCEQILIKLVENNCWVYI